jgi:tetratricopeptide (TPR) repeat protein
MSFDFWMGDRAVYCARLESVCAERHPGFESPPIRHAFAVGLTSRLRKGVRQFFCAFLFLVLFISGAGGQPAADIAKLLEKAKSAFERGNFDGALAALDQIDKVKSDDSQALDLRGMIYLEQGKFEEAKKTFRAASAADSARFSPQLHFADVLMREKKFSDARDAYTDLVEKTNVQVESEQVRFAILLTYLFEHNEARAQTAWERITFPTASPAYYCAQAAWEFAHNRKDDGKKWLKSAPQMYDAKAVAWFARPLYDFGWTKEKPPLFAP